MAGAAVAAGAAPQVASSMRLSTGTADYYAAPMGNFNVPSWDSYAMGPCLDPRVPLSLAQLLAAQTPPQPREPQRIQPRVSAEPPLTPSRSPYKPGEVLAKSATLASPGPATPTVLPPGTPEARLAKLPFPPGLGPQEGACNPYDESSLSDSPVGFDCSSACSTDDTAGSLSPGPFAAEPCNMGEVAYLPWAPGPWPPIGTAPPVLGPLEIMSEGSKGHAMGLCKPCAFIFKDGCANGVLCSFCHLCPPGVKKQRARERKAVRRAAKAGPVW